VVVNNVGYRQMEYIWQATEPGENVVLTIDLQVQRKAERALQINGPLTRGAFVVMDALPLNANGKLDRRALPAPEVVSTGEAAAPRDAVEERVAEVWREVLGLERIGIHDNFFDLGGTSLMLYRVYSRVRDLRADLRVVDLFRYTTVEELARHLSAAAALAAGAAHLDESRTRAEERRAARRRVRG